MSMPAASPQAGPAQLPAVPGSSLAAPRPRAGGLCRALGKMAIRQLEVAIRLLERMPSSRLRGCKNQRRRGLRSSPPRSLIHSSRLRVRHRAPKWPGHRRGGPQAPQTPASTLPNVALPLLVREVLRLTNTIRKAIARLLHVASPLAAMVRHEAQAALSAPAYTAAAAHQ